MITLESVSMVYETPAGPVYALDGISLQVEPGSSMAITGPSGCGKSTLLGLIAGLETPTNGVVSIAGQQISHLPERDRARLRSAHMGLVFQSDNLISFLTAVENVSLQLALHGMADDLTRCMRSLADLGLGEDTHKLPDQLSGGQRQRVAVARALVHRPVVILADEPTGSLDAENSSAVIDLLLAARREAGATLVVVTHDPAVASRLDRTLRLSDGRITRSVWDRCDA